MVAQRTRLQFHCSFWDIDLSGQNHRYKTIWFLGFSIAINLFQAFPIHIHPFYPFKRILKKSLHVAPWHTLWKFQLCHQHLQIQPDQGYGHQIKDFKRPWSHSFKSEVVSWIFYESSEEVVTSSNMWTPVSIPKQLHINILKRGNNNKQGAPSVVHRSWKCMNILS